MNSYDGYLREKSCGAVIYRKEENGELLFLLIKHKNGGHWSFPKGHIEAGETELITAHREILEETGLDVEIDSRFRFEMEYSPKPRVLKKVIFFVGEAKTAEVVPQPEEIMDIRWFPFSEALSSLTHEESKKLLTEGMHYVSGLE